MFCNIGFDTKNIDKKEKIVTSFDPRQSSVQEEQKKIVTFVLPSPKMDPRMGMEKRHSTASNPKKHAARK